MCTNYDPEMANMNHPKDSFEGTYMYIVPCV